MPGIPTLLSSKDSWRGAGRRRTKSWHDARVHGLIDLMISLPRLYAILDSSCFSTSEDIFLAAEELTAAGVTLIQYRNKSGEAQVMLNQARELRKRSRARESTPHGHGRHSPTLIMNDRADLCLAAEFDGVHVGQDDLSPENVRKIIGPERWL